MVVTDALGKVTVGWMVVWVLWRIGGDRWITEVPAIDTRDLGWILTQQAPLSLAVGWGVHAVTRRAAALDNSWAEVFGLLAAVGYFLMMRGLLVV